MFIIGERINGMFGDARLAIEERDERLVRDLARLQLEAGADALDLNVGPVPGDPAENMCWLVATAQQVTKAPLCLDTPRFSVLRAALEVCTNPVVINSCKATPAELDRYLPLAVERGARLIVLTMDEGGVPNGPDQRVALGATAVAQALEHGLPLSDLLLDPVAMPINVAPRQPAAVLGAMAQLRHVAQPPPGFVVGLSNVSQGCRDRTLLNSTYLAMCMAAGLTAAIMDVLDPQAVEVAAAAEVLLDRQLYCDDFVAAYLAG